MMNEPRAASSHSVDIIPLIPAYKPDVGLFSIVQNLLNSANFSHIVVVNDGSGPEHKHIFDSLAMLPQVTILHHHINLGKGRALRTGLNHIAVMFPHCIGSVTVDADGQHLVPDVVRVAEALRQDKHSLVLGCRQFTGKIPLRSRLGNIITRKMFRILVGRDVSDTQTGLRGIPYSFIDDVLRLKTEAYDFELDMLILAHSLNIPFKEVSIQTVYENNNASSHFNPLLDSFKIYILFFRFGMSSLLTAIIDYTIFSIIILCTNSIIFSLITARIIASAFNFITNKKLVFKSKEQNYKSQLIKYTILVLINTTITYGFIHLLTIYFDANVFLAKFCAEAVLYFISFIIQRELVFTVKK